MKGNIRVILYVLAFGIAFILWSNWQIANQPRPDQQSLTAANDALPGSAPLAVNDDLPGAAPSGDQVQPPVSANNAAQVRQAGSISVHTDLMNITINLFGGTVTRVELLKYPVSKNSVQPLALMREQNPGRFILQSGLGSSDGDSSKAPAHNEAVFSSAQKVYTLADGQDTLNVPLTWTNDAGITVTKVFTFTRGKYEFDLAQKVNNESNAPWRGYAYQQLNFGTALSSGGIGHVYTFTGGVVSTKADRYRKISLDDFAQSVKIDSDDGWIAIIQHYFLGALVPLTNGENNIFFTREKEGNHILGVASTPQTIAPGSSGVFDIHAYVGPKVQSRLQAVAPALDKTVDYGFIFMIAQPMFYVLTFIHGIVGNWGWAIVVMTLLIKLLFFAPSAWAYKSMAKMRRLQPQMKRLKERYGDDRQAMSQAMMKLYREEKVNPASGCLPMLLQIPFFIAFYWVLVESVELRQAPWILWIQDLSVRDPYFILPVINAGLMFLQQKLNPPPPDPMQAKIMMMLPLVFGFLFMWFPSGLVLYWSVSNGFSIVQQYVMNKRYGEPKDKLSKA